MSQETSNLPQGDNSTHVEEPRILPPYEVSLNKAFDKLTSEIFIFLLAYVILLVGMNVLGTGIPESLSDLLYILPVLGIGAYGWLRKRTVVRDPTNNGINVKALFASKGAYVAGIQDAPKNQSTTPHVNVTGGVILDAQIVGIDYTKTEQPPNTVDADFLLTLYSRLTPAEQINLIQLASKMVANH